MVDKVLYFLITKESKYKISGRVEFSIVFQNFQNKYYLNTNFQNKNSQINQCLNYFVIAKMKVIVFFLQNMIVRLLFSYLLHILGWYHSRAGSYKELHIWSWPKNFSWNFLPKNDSLISKCSLSGASMPRQNRLTPRVLLVLCWLSSFQLRPSSIKPPVCNSCLACLYKPGHWKELNSSALWLTCGTLFKLSNLKSLTGHKSAITSSKLVWQTFRKR